LLGGLFALALGVVLLISPGFRRYLAVGSRSAWQRVSAVGGKAVSQVGSSKQALTQPQNTPKPWERR